MIFTVDLEDHLSAIEPLKKRPYKLCLDCKEAVFWILAQLQVYNVKAIFYVLGMIYEKDLIEEIKSGGHIIGSHGFYHFKGERINDNSNSLAIKTLNGDLHTKYRSPYWFSTKRPGKAGGFYLRAYPYSQLKDELIRTGVLYLHPHDITLGEPANKNPYYWLKRHLGLHTSRAKVVQLLKEIKFDGP